MMANITRSGSLTLARPAPASRGLSEAEAAARRAQGQGNDFRLATSRSYVQILRAHALSFINTVLFIVGAALVVMGRYDDAILTAGMVVLNVIVGVSQETRAKIQLDRIALLTRPRATVMRDGQERAIDPTAIVVGDVMVIRAGDQIVVDGQVTSGRMEVDESLLTGESDRVQKRPGDAVYSGSFCVSGGAEYEVTKVGAASFANQVTAGARAFRQIKTPLQRDVDFVVRMLVLVATQIGILLSVSFALSGLAMVERIQVAAVIVALVPQGLFAMITVTYAMGALRMAGKGALIQRINAVESLSNVNVLCLDKTGTLTTNSLQYEASDALGVTDAELAAALGDFVASVSEGNRTADAIAAAFPGHRRPVVEEVTFSSARKWSALAFDGPPRRGVYVLGAPEMMQAALRPGSNLGAQAAAWTDRGLRVLLFAYTPLLSPLDSDSANPQLPRDLVPLGLISLRDELRPEAESTLRAFADAGVNVKIISGDNAQTVAALARQAGLSGDLRVISGIDLGAMDEEQFATAAREGNIFGRITPQQKERLVRSLRAQGHYVAMIGDGVNDVLSLKQAHIAIAMESGSQATRGVADIVLLEDSFAVLPTAVVEGRRIISGMEDVMRLVLTHTLYITLLIIACAVIGVAFPTTPKLRSIITVLTVGVPTLAIAAWARPSTPPRGLLITVMRFVMPASFTVCVTGLIVYLAYILNTHSVALARSELTTTLMFCGLLLVPFVEPPTRLWVGGDDYSGDRRPTMLAIALFGVYLLALLVPPFRQFFQLTELPMVDVLLAAGAAIVWAGVTRQVWRMGLFERIFTPSRT
jgi:cation-transporting P-type ATPase E